MFQLLQFLFVVTLVMYYCNMIYWEVTNRTPKNYKSSKAFIPYYYWFS